jgi:hypothetical protein
VLQGAGRIGVRPPGSRAQVVAAEAVKTTRGEVR